MFKKSFIFISLLALLSAVAPALAQDPIETVCLITDTGQVDDGTFNQYAHDGAVEATDEYGLEYSYIETQSQTDYDANIDTCLNEGFDVIITVGFLIADITLQKAEENPDTWFIGVDQFVTDGPENYVGIQFREDQGGFLVGALAALVAEMEDSNTIAGVYGIEIPPVIKYRHGYENGAKYINPDIETLGVYIDSFEAPDRGASAAEQFIGEGASVIFGAGGPTGSGGILAATQQGVYGIGVDQDEYYTTFEDGETPGVEYLISSALKRVDVGVADMISVLAEENYDEFPGGEVYILSVENGGIGFAEKHDADIPDEIYDQVTEVLNMMIDGEIETGVDPVTGELLTEGEEDPEATEEAAAASEEDMEDEEAE